MLPIDSRAGATRAHDHKQGFGPLEKITLIIRGCIRTCPQRERRGGVVVVGEGRQTEKEKAREQATSAAAFLHAVSYWCRVSPQPARRVSTRWGGGVGCGGGAATPPAERSAAATSTL